MIFKARQFAFTFPRPTVIMGIVNVTPDSFSDGGKFIEPERAVERALSLREAGAEIVDIGGESTRPNAEPVAEEEELRRVIPIIESVAKKSPKLVISIDTQKPAVARAAIAAGASIVNDVAANRTDPAMWHLVAQTGVGYIAMHMRGTPQTMQDRPEYGNVVTEVARFFVDRQRMFESAGIKPEQTALDVGIGFGKTVEQNLQLLRSISSFQSLGRPLLLGTSRKSFIGKLTDASAEERLPGSLASAVLGVRDGVQMVRVHDVAATKQALRVTEAIMGG